MRRLLLSLVLLLPSAALAGPDEPQSSPEPERTAKQFPFPGHLRAGPASARIIDTDLQFRRFSIDCDEGDIHWSFPVFADNLAAAPQVATTGICTLTFEGAAIEYSTPIKPYEDLICRPRQYPDRLQCWSEDERTTRDSIE